MADSPSKIVFSCILLLVIVYSSVVPLEYKRFADSPLGRIFGIAIVYGVIHQLGWVYGLLTAMAFLLLLHGGVSVREGFEVSKKRTANNRWYVEKILGKPEKIETEQVKTSAPGST